MNTNERINIQLATIGTCALCFVKHIKVGFVYSNWNHPEILLKWAWLFIKKWVNIEFIQCIYILHICILHICLLTHTTLCFQKIQNKIFGQFKVQHFSLSSHHLKYRENVEKHFKLKEKNFQ